MSLHTRLQEILDQGGELFESVQVRLTQDELAELLSALSWWASRKPGAADPYRDLLRSSEKYIEKAEAENAARRAEVEKLKLEGVTDRAKAMLNDVTNERNGLHNEIAALRAKLERAEAVCEAADVLAGWVRVHSSQTARPTLDALAKWREGK